MVVAFALASTTERPARAATTEVVVLKDGSLLRGALVELDDGDHVTVRLPTGETKRVEWSDIASSSQIPGDDLGLGAASLPAPPPPRSTMVAAPPAPRPTLIVAPPAPSAGRGVVMLKDGTLLRGDVLEWFQGDHVTLRLSDGEVKRFGWSRVALVASSAFRGGVRTDSVTTTTAITSSRSAPSADSSPSTPAAPATDADDVVKTTWPEPDRTAPPIMTSRLALGLDTGYRAPLGRFGLDAGWYPLRWIGFAFGYGLPVDGPSTTAENLFVTWPIAGPVEMGIGAGLAQSFVGGSNGGHSGVVSNLDLEALHLTFFGTRSLSVRASLGYALNLSGGDYCDAHPTLCPGTHTLYSTAGIAWNFDLGAGQK